jgi:hypothetical protein
LGKEVKEVKGVVQKKGRVWESGESFEIKRLVPSLTSLNV